MTKSKYHVAIYAGDVYSGMYEISKEYNTEEKYTPDEAEKIFKKLEDELNSANGDLDVDKYKVKYEEIESSREEIKLLNIHMITTYSSRRHFYGVTEGSIKNIDGYLTFEQGDKYQHVKASEILEYYTCPYVEEDRPIAGGGSDEEL